MRTIFIYDEILSEYKHVSKKRGLVNRDNLYSGGSIDTMMFTRSDKHCIAKLVYRTI
jgi:hypothetical protein